jgi:mannose-6-phosphate isomerase-like protein (cupin superfamily)
MPERGTPQRKGPGLLQPTIFRPDPKSEFETPERCRILQSWDQAVDPDVSIARATVAPGVATQLHSLHGVDERYLIVQGRGLVTLSQSVPVEVQPGDVVIIPRDTPQKIANTSSIDLVFYCICTPKFVPECYRALGE